MAGVSIRRMIVLTLRRGTLFTAWLACVICALRALHARRRPRAGNALLQAVPQRQEPAGTPAARSVDDEDPAEVIVAGMLGSPFLIASAGFASLGTSWVALRLVLKHPWLLAFGASGCCFGLHTVQVAYRSGSVQPLRDAEEALDKPVFESIYMATAAVTQYFAKWARVMLLASGDLDENQSEQLLNELDEDFVYDVFQRPSREWLPQAFQLILLSLRPPAKVPGALSPAQLASLQPKAEPTRPGDSPRGSVASTKGSVASVMEILRFHGQHGSSSTALQRVFTTRVTSLTIAPVKDITKEQTREALTMAREMSKDVIDTAMESPWKTVRSAVGLGVRIPLAAGRLGAGAAYNRLAPEFVKSTVDMASKMRDGDGSDFDGAHKFAIENVDFDDASPNAGVEPDVAAAMAEID